MIYKVYKKVGETTLASMQAFLQSKNIEGEKATFAGRLDPMASGVFLVLTGEDRFKKDEYNSCDKEYKTQILFGAKTDTGDLLGLVQGVPEGVGVNVESVEDIILDFSGQEVEWEYPCFSSKTYKGKQLFKWFLEDRCTSIKERPKYKSKIYSVKLNKVFEIANSELEKKIFEKLDLLQESSVNESYKDFRIREVKESWRNFFKQNENNFYIAEVILSVSKSFYVRTFAEKVGEAIGSNACAFSIERTKIGKGE